MKSLPVYSLLLAVFFLTSCDKFPEFLRRSENQVKKEYYEWEADDEDVEAMYLAAKHSCCGEDNFSDSDVEALNLFCKAAKNGHKASMVEIGRLYLNETTIDGTIIPYDRAIAFTFFSIAEQNGYDKAQYHRERVLEEMNDTDFARATRLVESFPVVPCEIIR